MIIKLRNGAWERREICGCKTIYDGMLRTRYQCKGHQTHPCGWWVETLKVAEPIPLPYTHEHVPGVGDVSLQFLVDKAIAALSGLHWEVETISKLRQLANPTTLEEWQDLVFFADSKSTLFRNRCRVASVDSDRCDYSHIAFTLLKVEQFAERMCDAFRFEHHTHRCCMIK